MENLNIFILMPSTGFRKQLQISYRRYKNKAIYGHMYV
jgi:hypothetical protein